MAEDTGCLHRLQWLLAKQIEKARQWESEEEEALSKDARGNHCDGISKSVKSSSRQHKDVYEERHASKASSINSDLSTTQPCSPRKRKAPVSPLTSDTDCTFASPQKVFIIAPEEQREPEKTRANSSRCQLSQRFSDVSSVSHMAQASADTPRCGECFFVECEAEGFEKVHSRTEQMTGCNQNESWVSSQPLAKDSEREVDGKSISSDKQLKKEQDTTHGCKDAKANQSFEPLSRDCPSQAELIYVKSQTHFVPKVPDNETGIGQTKDCHRNNKRKAVDNITDTDKKRQEKCLAIVSENPTVNTVCGDKHCNAKNQSFNKQTKPDGEWEYDCDLIDRLLSPPRYTPGRNDLSLFQELQQAKQKERDVESEEHFISSQSSVEIHHPENGTGIQDYEDQSFRLLQHQQANALVPACRNPGLVFENTSPQLHVQNDSNKTSEIHGMNAKLCKADIVSQSLSGSVIQDGGQGQSYSYSLQSCEHNQSPEESEGTAECVSNIDPTVVHGVFFDCVCLTRDAPVDREQRASSSNHFATCKATVASFPSSESETSVYEDCHSDTEQLHSDPLLPERLHFTENPQIPHITCSEETDSSSIEHLSRDDDVLLFLGTVYNGQCELCGSSINETGHCLCRYTPIFMDTLVEELNNVDGLYLSVPSEVLGGVDIGTEQSACKTQQCITDCSVFIPARVFPEMAHWESGYNKGKVYGQSTDSSFCSCSVMDRPFLDNVGTECLQSREQALHCLLTLNNNSLPSQSNAYDDQRPLFTSMYAAGGSDYQLEYNYTRRPKHSSPSLSQLLFRNPRIRRSSRECPWNARGYRCRYPSRIPSYRPYIPKAMPGVIPGVSCVGSHPQNCKCFQNDCLRRRGEILHDHVMKNLRVLKKFAEGDYNKRSNLSLQIKEAEGSKAAESMWKQRACGIAKQKYYSPGKKSTRSPETEASSRELKDFKRSTRVKGESRLSSNEYLRNSPSEDYSSLQAISQTQDDRQANCSVTQRKATSGCPVCGTASTTKPLFYRRTLTHSSNDVWQDRRFSKRRFAFSGIKLHTQEVPCVLPEDTLFKMDRTSCDRNCISCAEIAKGSPNITQTDYLVQDTLDHMHALKLANEECDRMIRQLEEHDFQGVTTSRADVQNGGQIQTRNNGELIECSSYCMVKSPTDYPQSVYCLSVEVPNPTLHDTSVVASVLQPTARFRSLIHETRDAVTREEHQKVTRDLRDPLFYPVEGETASYYHCVSQESADEEAESAPVNGPLQSVASDLIRADGYESDSAPISNFTEAKVDFQTPQDDVKEGFHILGATLDSNVDNSAQVIQNFYSNNVLISEDSMTRERGVGEAKTFSNSRFEHTEPKTSILVSSSAESRHSSEMAREMEAVHVLSVPGQSPDPVSTNHPEKAVTDSDSPKASVDISIGNTLPLPVVLSAKFSGDSSQISSYDSSIDKTVPTEHSLSTAGAQQTNCLNTTLSQSSSSSADKDSQKTGGVVNASQTSSTLKTFDKSQKFSLHSQRIRPCGSIISSSCRDSRYPQLSCITERSCSSLQNSPASEEFSRHLKTPSRNPSNVRLYQSSLFDTLSPRTASNELKTITRKAFVSSVGFRSNGSGSLPGVTHPRTSSGTSPVVTHPRSSSGISPVVTHPRSSSGTSPVVTRPRTSPVVTHPRTSNGTSPVVTRPRTSPVVTHPRTSNGTSSVVTHPWTSSGTSPVMTHPRTSVVTHPRTSSGTSPVVTHPRASPVVTHPRTSPVVTHPRTSPVVTHPRTSNGTSPVVTHPRTSPVVTHPRTSPVVTHPRTSNGTSPVVAHPRTSNGTSPVMTHPRTSPLVTHPRTSVVTHPRTSSGTSPVVTHLRTSPVVTHPRTSNGTSPVVTHPRTSNGTSPVVTHPRTSPVVTHPRTSNGTSPVVTHPRTSNGTSPVMTHPRTSPVVTHPRTSNGTSPVMTHPRTSNGTSPVMTHLRTSPVVTRPRTSPVVTHPRTWPVVTHPRTWPVVTHQRTLSSTPLVHHRASCGTSPVHHRASCGTSPVHLRTSSGSSHAMTHPGTSTVVTHPKTIMNTSSYHLKAFESRATSVRSSSRDEKQKPWRSPASQSPGNFRTLVSGSGYTSDPNKKTPMSTFTQMEPTQNINGTQTQNPVCSSSSGRKESGSPREMKTVGSAPPLSVKNALDAVPSGASQKVPVICSSGGQSSSPLSVSSVSKTSSNLLVTFSESDPKNVCTPAEPYSNTFSFLLSPLLTVFERLRTYTSSAWNAAPRVKVSEGYDAMSLVPDHSKLHHTPASFTSANSCSFSGEDELQAGDNSNVAPAKVESVSSVRYVESNSSLTHVVLADEGYSLTNQTSHIQTKLSSSSVPMYGGLSVSSVIPGSSNINVNADMLPGFQESPLLTESVGSQDIQTKVPSVAPVPASTAKVSQAPQSHTRNCPNEGVSLPQWVTAGGEAVVAVALVLQYFCYFAERYSRAVKTSVMMAVLVALVTGGYLCGCHCCLSSLALKSSINLERLVEDVLVHLNLHHVTLPPS